jgi:tight adherence protein C
MSGLVWLMLAMVFITLATVVYGIIAYYQNRQKIKERIKGGQTQTVAILRREERENPLKKRVMEWVSRLGKWGVKDPGEATLMRSTLIQAGFRHPKASAVYFGLRALLAFSLPLPYLLATIMKGKAIAGSSLLLAFLLSAGGFYLPQYFLAVITRRRQDQIDKALPDVLDLLIVCMEAGLAMQATFNRVADEIKAVSKELHKELLITNAELRTGIPREMALKNLGDRTGVQSVKSLVGLMVQSEKMGASIAQSLRTHAAFTRVQRAQRAEEIAAKLPVKILMPMIFFIFPAIFVVVLGPAIISISKTPFFTG